MKLVLEKKTLQKTQIQKMASFHHASLFGNEVTKHIFEIVNCPYNIIGLHII
jgi:hypothetical protein